MKTPIFFVKNEIKNSKFTLIFAHGWGCTSKTMMPLAKLWMNQYTTYVLDLPGFGKSKLDHPYVIDDYIMVIESFINENHLENIVFIGHSFGGKLAFYLKKRNPTWICIAIAPSVIKPRASLKKWLKIKIYHLFKKRKWKVPKFLLGSKDYQNAEGYLKATFINIVHSYFTKHDIQEISSMLIFAFTQDKEVRLSRLKKIKKWNKKMKLIIVHGDHFGYLTSLLYTYDIIQDWLVKS